MAAGIRANGHLLLNSAKMSKSDGNFMTLAEAVKKFSADGTRICLADSGDTVEDANFVEVTADAGILRLYTFIEWVKEMLASKLLLRSGAERTFNDRVFLSEMHKKTQEADGYYQKALFREALRVGFFEFQSCRDKYRELCGAAGMHVDLIFEFIRRQALLMAPICPHAAEHVWQLLGNKGTIVNAAWPEVGVIDEIEIKKSDYIMDAAHFFRLVQKQTQTAGKGKQLKTKPTDAVIWVAKTYPPWQSSVINLMKTLYEVSR